MDIALLPVGTSPSNNSAPAPSQLHSVPLQPHRRRTYCLSGEKEHARVLLKTAGPASHNIVTISLVLCSVPAASAASPAPAPDNDAQHKHTADPFNRKSAPKSDAADILLVGPSWPFRSRLQLSVCGGLLQKGMCVTGTSTHVCDYVNNAGPSHHRGHLSACNSVGRTDIPAVVKHDNVEW